MLLVIYIERAPVPNSLNNLKFLLPTGISMAPLAPLKILKKVLAKFIETIFQAVMDSVAVREKMEVNAGDDVDNDGNEIDKPIEPCPTRRDVLKAVSTINWYIEDLNDPISRKFEALVGSFNRQLRFQEAKSMKESPLPDYFQTL